MSTFHGGIADGKSVALRRAPILLRVVVDPDGRVDALYDPDDLARPHERISLYILTKHPVHMHIRMANRKQSGFYSDGDYQLCPLQPDDATLRDNAKYFTWCDERKDLLMPKWAKEKTQ